MRRLDLTGQTYGDWTVLFPDTTGKHGKTYWWCQCTCGTMRVVATNNLRNGRSRSCGHDQGKRLIVHVDAIPMKKDVDI